MLQVVAAEVSSPGGVCLFVLSSCFRAPSASEYNPLCSFGFLLPGFRWVSSRCVPLCLVRALRVFLRCTSALSPRPCTLFVSPRCPSRSLSLSARFVLLSQMCLSPVFTLPCSRFSSFFRFFIRFWSFSFVLFGGCAVRVGSEVFSLGQVVSASTVVYLRFYRLVQFLVLCFVIVPFRLWFPRPGVIFWSSGIFVTVRLVPDPSPLGCYVHGDVVIGLPIRVVIPVVLPFVHAFSM